MLIFDRFPSRTEAEAFAQATELKTCVFDTQTESNLVDPFPYLLEPPIVLVERGERDDEIERLVINFGGEFAGT